MLKLSKVFKQIQKPVLTTLPGNPREIQLGTSNLNTDFYAELRKENKRDNLCKR